MKLYRLHKYDPTLYDELGRYTRDEWIHVSDICYRPTALNREEYLRVENAYVKSINRILDYQDVDQLQVFSDGFSIEEVEDYQKYLFGFDPAADFRYAQGQWVDRERAAHFCRLCLRDLQGGALSDRKTCFVLFSGDFYVHLGCSQVPKYIIKEIEANGLTLESKGQLGDIDVDNELYGELVPDRT